MVLRSAKAFSDSSVVGVVAAAILSRLHHESEAVAVLFVAAVAGAVAYLGSDEDGYV